MKHWLMMALMALTLAGGLRATTNCSADYAIVGWDEKRLMTLVEVGGECVTLSLTTIRTDGDGNSLTTKNANAQYLSFEATEQNRKQVMDFVKFSEPGLTVTGRTVLKAEGEGFSDGAIGLKVQPPLCGTACKKKCQALASTYYEPKEWAKLKPYAEWPIIEGLELIESYRCYADRVCLRLLSAEWLPYGTGREGYLVLVVKSPYSHSGDESRGLQIYRGRLTH